MGEGSWELHEVAVIQARVVGRRLQQQGDDQSGLESPGLVVGGVGRPQADAFTETEAPFESLGAGKGKLGPTWCPGPEEVPCALVSRFRAFCSFSHITFIPRRPGTKAFTSDCKGVSSPVGWGGAEKANHRVDHQGNAMEELTSLRQAGRGRLVLQLRGSSRSGFLGLRQDRRLPLRGHGAREMTGRQSPEP